MPSHPWARRSQRGTVAKLAALLIGAGPFPAAAQLFQVPDSGKSYWEKALAAQERGETELERRFLEEGIQAVGPNSNSAFAFYHRLGEVHSDLGYAALAAKAADHLFEIAQKPPQRWVAAIRAYGVYSHLHVKPKVEEYGRRLESVQRQLRSLPVWPRLGMLWQGQLAWARGQGFSAAGRPDQAADAFKGCLGSVDAYLRSDPEEKAPALFLKVDCTTGLLQTLLTTGQLAEAGAVADQLRIHIKEFADMGRRPAIAARVGSVFGRLATEQGRFDEAEAILRNTLAQLEKDANSGRSMRVMQIYLSLAQVAMLRGQWREALSLHEKRAEGIRAMRTEGGSRGPSTVDFAYTLIRLGQPERALKMMREIVNSRQQIFDENALPLWESRAFLGSALAANGQHEAALKEMRVAVPRVLDILRGERSSSESGLLRTTRLNWILDSYIALLVDHAQTPGAPAADAAVAIDEAFRMADLARGSTVQRALAASAARANVPNPALAELARTEQDLQRELSALAEDVNNLLSRGRVAEQDQIVADMRANLAKLRDQHAKAQSEIERRFPEYASLLNPKPVGMAAIQKLLRPTEAVISIYAGSSRSVVWAIPAKGPPSFAVVPLGREQLDLKVDTLRQALDPTAEIGGRLPKYRFDISHELYVRLLKPVDAGWKGASELIVIPHGRLGQLPFGVMTTAPFSPPGSKLPYAELADAPWLIKEIAVSQLPAATALPALRYGGRQQKADRPFIGFGDPLFVADAAQALQAGTRGGLKRRNLVISAKPQAAMPEVEPTLAPPINFSLLPPLPDTALEISEVALALSADKHRDVFLKQRASESEVKKIDLSPYRVIMFATHGLMNGEMPGLYQPALALSNPALTKEKEDGMLTMEEILNLRLNADWVVLSACNSASAGGKSDESVSGLGRAFFFAGAKSLLVTNWAVETESARMLTTEAFKRQVANPTLSRARALQQSSVSLMSRSAGGSYSYAHPMFWGPYSLVGDGG